MKVLHYYLSSRMGAHAHVEALCKKIRRKYWVLYHLQKAGFKDEELAKVYRTCILPVIDYCSVVYHAQLMDELDQIVERLQVGALWCIYGHDVSYSRMRELAEVTMLKERRIQASDESAAKCALSERFGEWFPLREGGRRWARRTYVKEYARCERLLNTPLFYMRRRMNGKPEKTYGERNRIYRDTNMDYRRSDTQPRK